QASAPDAGLARPVHDPGGARPDRGPPRCNRRRRSPFAGSALEHSGARVDGRARDAGWAATAHPARDRGDGLRGSPRDRCDQGRGRGLRPTHAAGADGRGRQLRALAARVHGAMGRDARAAAAGTEGDAPRADEPRRRDRRHGRRCRRCADRAPGALGARRPGGRALRPAHPRARRAPGGGPARERSRVMLLGKAGQENLVVRGARVVDPTEGVDAVLDVRVDAGVVAQLGTNLETNEHRVIDGDGLLLAPAFVDPHVHLRSPGREDEETIATGTAAAAAGGYCVTLAMPNPEPVIDSAAVLGSLAEAAGAEAEVPAGFLAAITKGQDGAGLTEMAELADPGGA